MHRLIFDWVNEGEPHALSITRSNDASARPIRLFVERRRRSQGPTRRRDVSGFDTHQWGRDFSAWFAGGEHDGEFIWMTPNYDTNTDHPFDPPAMVRAGEGFQFECTYDNTENRRLRFGVNATDEMCILFGTYWDAHGAYEPPDETCDVTWVDAQGIGRSAYANGGFPPPSEGEVSACLAGAGAAASDPCTQCTCNSCATIAIKCFTDADCGPIAQCRAPTDCEPVLDQHSSGVGLAQQLNGCVVSKCSQVCAQTEHKHH